jgi:dTDP-4-dehydrorhamnose 3,5-epimerase
VRFQALDVAGAHEILAERREDDRGYFARTFCADELREHGLEPRVAQANTSFNRRRATLRGLHLQRPPHGEVKIVTCTRGRVFDVVADLRPESSTFLGWAGVELSAETSNQVYVPEGCAHGYLTLEEGCEVRYLVSAPYEPTAEAGVRWDDPALPISWPFDPAVVSGRDLAFPPLDVERLRVDGLARLGLAEAR